MTRRWTKSFKYIAVSAFLLTAVWLMGKAYFQSRAVFDGDGVHINAAEQEDSMLIIGTHLIHLSALNDELYQLAEASASNSNQTSRYYKSELADGKWMDITTASSLSDIMENGTIVENAEIEALYITHKTGADGITRDLRTGETVSIFDIRPLYELEAMEELEPLKLQYDMMKESEDAEQDQIDQIKEFFEKTKLQTDAAKEYDLQMKALQKYYKVLAENNGPKQEQEMVTEVMGKVDSGRRALVYQTVKEALDKLSEQVENSADEPLLNAIQNSMKNLEEGLIEAQGNALAAGDMVIGSLQYQSSIELIDAAKADNHAGCDRVVDRLIQMKHIEDAQITDAAGELGILREEIIPLMDEQYRMTLSSGVSPAYKEAQEAKSSHVVLNNIMEQDTAVQDTDRSELQFYIQSAVDRMDKEAAIQYIKERMEKVADFSGVIPEDEFRDKAQASTDAHLLWLQKLLSSTSGESGDASMNQLYEEKADLQEKKMEALDRQDIDGAKRLEARIEAKEAEIEQAGRAKEAELNRLYEQKSKLEADALLGDAGKAQIAALDREIAIAAAGLSDGQEAANVERLKLEAKEAIQNGGAESLAGLEASLDGLAVSLSGGSSLAGNALKELYKDLVSASFLQDKGEYDELIGKLEETIAENSDKIRPQGETLSPESAVTILEEALGGSIKGSIEESTEGSMSGTEAGDGTGSGGTDTGAAGENSTAAEDAGTGTKQTATEENLAAVMALAAYGEETGDSKIQRSAQTLASSLAGEPGCCLFIRRKGIQEDSVSVQALAEYTGYRYLWNDTRKTAVLSKGETYYQFTAFSRNVVKNGEKKTAEMPQAAGYAGVLYLPGEYTAEEFGCKGISIPGTEYSVLVNDEVIELSQELTDLLMAQTMQ